MARTVMSGFKPELVPVYAELANEFAVFDQWFASVPESTQPNRFYVHSATSHGASNNVKKDLISGKKHVVMLLGSWDEAHATWVRRTILEEQPLGPPNLNQLEQANRIEDDDFPPPLESHEGTSSDTNKCKCSTFLGALIVFIVMKLVG
ncbi:hypothetical protein RHSIM_Rhsim10G0100600 [Rhododendron simsii]|uniref:Uncharacterized protein n=1 Tax=Rhododendron simsii TaxID=118357 RepID=A0A834LDL9_RHOSS|nr:hypothetical protein RHSIM_Rhsim10G0100600 [Rhododendron simsii]